MNASLPVSTRYQVPETLEEGVERGHLVVGHLERGEHAAEVGAMIAVVEQADVPAAAERVEELEQRAGAFRELESAGAFVPRVERAAPDHVPHVELRHLVVGEVERLVPAALSRSATRTASWRDEVLTPTKICAASRRPIR